MNLVKHKIHFQRFTPIVFILAVLSACTTIAPIDQKAYEQATSLKVDTRNLLALATENYSSHVDEIKALKINLEKAQEYANGRPKNEDSISQWQLLLDPQGDLLGGLLREWKEDGKLLPGYIKSKQTQIARSFDTISGLESGKNKPTAAQ